MALSLGARLGPYEILSALGAGGMGEVYRARDTRLKRDVAIKVLPDSLACDVDRLSRFEREAEILASLNHPHIAAIYGVEDAPADAGLHVHALVMELVEGETLAERLHRGPLPLTGALRIAAQMAEALEAAHERGVVHRDLKPANVKITPDESVKVLDFGLAKAMEGEPAAANISASPTLSIMATQAGMILGTAAYMSPEQARGFPADQRSDIFSFGCVLYEMLTGHQAFQGETASDVLASVLAREPDLNALPPNLNPRLPELLKRCLEKNPKKRWQAVGDLRAEIETIATAPHAAATTAVATRQEPRWRRLTFVGVPALVAGAVIAGGVVWFATRPVAARVTRTAITNTGTAALTISNVEPDLAITPDGTQVVYVGNGGTQLFVRALDALEPVAIASGQLRGPFVSPDGQWVGFFDNSFLRKVAITGGPPITLASIDAGSRGATWAPDGTIIFATANPATGLQRVSAAGGGTPETLTRPDGAQGEADHLWPELLPGGGAVLFTITSRMGAVDSAQVAVLDLRTGTQKVLLRGGSRGHYVTSGHLVYGAAGTLRAILFDPNRIETGGTAVPVLPRLAITNTGAGNFAMAADGTLVYVDAPGSLGTNARTLVWVDRTGKEETVAAPPRAYEHPRLSPDGTRVALSSSDQEYDVWILDLARTTLTRLTLDPGQDWFPMWTPDGRRISFSSIRGSGPGRPNLWWMAADGTGTAERLTTSTNAQFVSGITPDGTAAVYNEATPGMGRDLLQVALDGMHRVTPLVQTKFDERNGIVSPDGRWLAYESNSSGPFEIYVRPFPNVSGGQWQVSTAGGR